MTIKATDTYSLTAAARAENGAARLDEMFGRQWAGFVDPERLNMSDMHDDVLGQLYGSFVAGKLAAKFNRYMCELYGFQALHYMREEATKADEKELTAAWVSEINSRKAITPYGRNSRRSPRGSENPSCGSGEEYSDTSKT